MISQNVTSNPAWHLLCQVVFPSKTGVIDIIIWRLVLFEDFGAKATGSYVDLRGCNSGAKSGIELIKGSKDVASLLFCTRKKFFGWGVLIFCEWCQNCRTFRTPWRTSPGLGPKPSDGSISLKFLLETRLQSELFNTLDDLLGYRVEKVWCKVIKIFE